MNRTRTARALLVASFALAAQSPDAANDGRPASQPTTLPASRPATGPEARAVDAAPTQDAGQGAAVASDPAALALFRKAAADQTPGDPAFELRDLQVDLVATVYEKGEDGKRRPRTANITEFWRAGTAADVAPRYRRDLVEPAEGKETVHGFDGRAYWEKLGKSPARALQGRDDRDTRKQLAEELDRLNQLAATMLLRKLDTPDATFVLLPAPTAFVADGRSVPVRGVRRTRPGKPAEDLFFGETALGDGPAKTVIVGYRRDKDGTKPEESLSFSAHVVAGAGKNRLLVPRVVETYQNGELQLVGRVRHERDLKFNLGLEDALFSPALK
jgi:hypothetical protein